MSEPSYFLKSNQLIDSDRLILFYQNKILSVEDNYIWEKSKVEKYFPLGSIFLVIEEFKHRTLAIELTTDVTEELSSSCRSLRSFLFGKNASHYRLAGRASQILSWYKGHQYCGACGTKTQYHKSQRALSCPTCEEQYFPRINPCVIMLVTKGREILLARSARFKTGFFSCLAGFIEVGETAEDTVAREIKEEVGVMVENIRYIKSQSWPFPSQLMLGFHADYVSGEITPEPSEIEEAHWYDVENLPAIPSPDISVAGELIKIYTDLVKKETV